jgi:hypothetical protein
VQWLDHFRRNYWVESGDFRDNYGRFDAEYYKGWNHWTWLNSDTRKPVEYRHDISYSTLHDGRSFNYEPLLTWKPLSNLELSGSLSWYRIWNVAEYEDKTLDFTVWSPRVQWSPRLNVTVRATWQYRNDPEFTPTPDNPDPASPDNLLTNLLLAWNWNPGSWFYLVYDEAGRPVHPIANDTPGGRTIRAKLTYFFTVP